MVNRLTPNARLWIGRIALVAIPLLFIVAFFLGTREEPEPELEPPVVDLAEGEKLHTEEELAREAPVLPSEEDKMEAQDVAAAFVMGFHSFDAENPTAYAEAAAPYMSEKLKAQYAGQVKRGTLETASVTVSATETLPSELQETVQIWTVGATATRESVTGATEQELAVYSVLLIREGDAWKVDGVKALE